MHVSCHSAHNIHRTLYSFFIFNQFYSTKATNIPNYFKFSNALVIIDVRFWPLETAHKSTDTTRNWLYGILALFRRNICLKWLLLVHLVAPCPSKYPRQLSPSDVHPENLPTTRCWNCSVKRCFWTILDWHVLSLVEMYKVSD